MADDGLFKGLLAQTTALFDMPEHLEQAAVVRALAIREDHLMNAMLAVLSDELGSLPKAQATVDEGLPNATFDDTDSAVEARHGSQG